MTKTNIIYKKLLFVIAPLAIAGLILTALRPNGSSSEVPTISNSPSETRAVGQRQSNQTNAQPPTAKKTEAQPGSRATTSSESTSEVVKTNKVIASKTIQSNGKEYPLRQYQPLLVPNDPKATQWWTTSTELPNAWDIQAGGTPTTVAVIDTGFSLNHEELNGRWFKNTGEEGTASLQGSSQLNCSDRQLSLDASCNMIDDNYDTVVDNETGFADRENPSLRNCSDRGLPLNKACNLMDDDSNGYIDDVSGWDFANFDPSVQAGQTNPTGPGTTHGTMVSGVLAATGNNGVGIAGVNWSTRVLPIQALDDDSYGDTLTVARSVRYAADMKSDVISLSLGTYGEDPYLREAIMYAIEKGSIVVAASGNDGCDCVVYPARYPEVIAVGAISQNGERSSFSNYGTSLDIVAPGDTMLTSTWSNQSPTNAYTTVAGTSFATPYISGLLSLALSHQPQATDNEVVAALLSSADHRGLSTASPHSPLIGYGYANAGRAMQRVSRPLSSAVEWRFSPVTSHDSLGSLRVRQCRVDEHPIMPVFEIRSSAPSAQKAGALYTISNLQAAQARLAGLGVSTLTHACVSLPTDTAQTIRQINLPTEIR